MTDEDVITPRSEGLLGEIGRWGAALITDEELLEALAAHDAEVRASERGLRAQMGAAGRQMQRDASWLIRWVEDAEAGGVDAAALSSLREHLAGASVVSEEPDWEWGVGWRSGWSTRLMGVAHTSRAAAEADVADSNADPADNLEYFLVRRVPERQAGWWLPVEQEGETDA